MLKEPLDRQANSILKTCLRIPANFFFDLVRCDRITTVMTLAVLYVSDQVFRLRVLYADLPPEAFPEEYQE